MKTRDWYRKNTFVLIEGVEMVLMRGQWIRVPTTILYTGDDQDFWEVVSLESQANDPVLVVQTA